MPETLASPVCLNRALFLVGCGFWWHAVACSVVIAGQASILTFDELHPLLPNPALALLLSP
jgi:hypothetical protein